MSSHLVGRCQHKKVMFANVVGQKKENFNEVDFVVCCVDCDEELFRISEYGREIVNVSKH